MASLNFRLMMMSRTSMLLGGLLFVSGLNACASLPEPKSLVAAHDVHEHPNTTYSRRFAPDATEHAEELYLDAARAQAKGKPTAEVELRSQIALTAYEGAYAEARYNEAVGLQQKAEKETARVNAEAKDIDRQVATLSREVDADELKLALLEENRELPEVEKSFANREAARHQATLSVLVDAKMYCFAAETLAAKQPASAPVAAADEKTGSSMKKSAVSSNDKTAESDAKKSQEVTATELLVRVQELNDKIKAKPPSMAEFWTAALTLRMECLNLLSQNRMNPAKESAIASEYDVLASSELDLKLKRDERGIYFYLPTTWKSEQLAELSKILGGIHRRQPLLSLLLIAHGERDATAAKKLTQLLQLRLAEVDKSLQTTMTSAGAEQPLVSTKLANAREVNDRLELVLLF